ncbi:uncharacterized protein LOC110640740 isoform X3 [Hevea brasiliensis]|uniref:uncharacterized protein LOC110640740 isoform X3 n=1 Tax=Hevea brasiliensis TaxID=3981 RepID=UPI0025DCA7CA|nr:uncharacterized protein LOC110640740 isoform X3 [Hevea brasiliensis]
MWRRSAFPGNSDSDQSISDGEELNGDLVDNCFSLNANAEKERGFLLQSRMEILRGMKDGSLGKEAGNLIHENQTSFFVGDEVEVPDFPNDGGLIFSQRKESKHHQNEEIISDDEDDYVLANSITSSDRKLNKDSNLHILRSEKQDEACTWSMISKEAEALNHLNEQSLSSFSAFSKANKSCQGVGDKVKLKFSLRIKSHKDGLFHPFIPEDENVTSSKALDAPEELEPIEDETIENSNLEFLEDFHGENGRPLKVAPADVEAIGNGLIEHSMAELLEGLRDRNVLQRGNSQMFRRTKGKRAQLMVKKNVSPLGDRVIDDEEKPEQVITGSSSDDEGNYQNLDLANPEMKRQSMADRFQEALAATSFSNDDGAHVAAAKLSGIGLFRKLQQVMQSEKERDANFLKKIQMGASPSDNAHSIVVKILSRYLDAKLTVCHCMFCKNVEVVLYTRNSNSTIMPRLETSLCYYLIGSSLFPFHPGIYGSQKLVDREREGTVIFSPRICSDVDLEVGNLICIHPPWKEVQVMGNDKSTILSTYFSNILV